MARGSDAVFICVAKALMLPSDDAAIAELCRTFSGDREVGRHFQSFHLKFLNPDDETMCPICVPRVHLVHRMHLQHHAEVVHGIRTQTTF